MSFNFNIEMEQNSESSATATVTESYVPEAEARSVAPPPPPPGLEKLFSPLAPVFRPRGEMLGLMTHQEPKLADTAPVAPQIDEETLLNLRSSAADMLFDDVTHNRNHNFFMGTPKAESVSSNLWGEGSSGSTTSARHDGAYESFDFLAKTLTSANNYLSMLTREQVAVLSAFRPGLLYEFLQEVARVRTEQRLRRAASHECAFCKNNGENEDCYASHSLKDCRGKVLCPVLRAFRCPRCGATGDRAHTIKYCPEQGDNGLERSGSFARRRVATSSFLFDTQQHQPTPTPSPASTTPSFGKSSIWNNWPNI